MSDPTTSKLRALASELRDHNKVISDLEERLKSEKARVWEITTDELVEVMNTMDTTNFQIKSQGNSPAMAFELGHHYSGSISSEWEEPRREAAFDALPEDLIKITVKAIFAKGEAAIAQDLAEELITAGYTIQIEKGVHHSTLKAWLREQFENGESLPDLETIGARIFQEVKVREID